MKAKRGQILKDLRKLKGLNQSYFSDMLGISLTAYQKYEHGTAEPNFDNLSKLADFYGVTTDYLLGRETNNPFEGISLDEEDTQLILALAKLPSNIRKCTLNLLVELIKEVQESKN